MILLIPAYQPDEKLTELVVVARVADPAMVVLVVDDGSGPGYAGVFDAARSAGALVVGYQVNRGKGFALKTGIKFIVDAYPDQPVVCADCDGQHSMVDILRVAERLRTSDGAMVLGVRVLTGDIPTRSRIGNAVSRRLFRLSTGRTLQDTQTGLRGYPAELLEWAASVCGNRYEYEFNLLLEACQTGRAIETVDISTIYLAENASSHFRPLADSVRIYAPLLKFVLSSLTAFAVDTAAVLLLSAVTGSLLLAVVGARVVSSATNFLVNRRVVFSHGRDRSITSAAMGYFGLAAGLLAVNYVLLLALTTTGLPLFPAKLCTDLTLFLISYAVQSRLLFTGQRSVSGSATHPLPERTSQRSR